MVPHAEAFERGRNADQRPSTVTPKRTSTGTLICLWPEVRDSEMTNLDYLQDGNNHLRDAFYAEEKRIRSAPAVDALAVARELRLASQSESLIIGLCFG
jgi:hypothetical protein